MNLNALDLDQRQIRTHVKLMRVGLKSTLGVTFDRAVVYSEENFERALRAHGVLSAN